MVLVPKGCFMMGSDEPLERAAPIHRQCFERPFWIDRTEVTNAQFGSVGIWADPIYPRDSVTWLEALNHCQARGARLPTEAEWEYAARGPDNLIYPWGNEMIVANSINTESNGEPAPVGSIPQGASWVGAYDMSGNLAEWVSSRFDPYPHNAFDGRESGQDIDQDTELDEDHTEEVFRVQRGGSFAEADLRFQRATSRFGEAADHTFASIGFRCARDFVDR
jgi:iron(II)-dependent oxidoreductase